MSPPTAGFGTFETCDGKLCPVVGEDRKWPTHRRNDVIDR
jgi:hypothetical protein